MSDLSPAHAPTPSSGASPSPAAAAGLIPAPHLRPGSLPARCSIPSVHAEHEFLLDGVLRRSCSGLGSPSSLPPAPSAAATTSAQRASRAAALVLDGLGRVWAPVDLADPEGLLRMVSPPAPSGSEVCAPHALVLGEAGPLRPWHSPSESPAE